MSGYMICCFFCFFKQKTAYEMRISDWSSDVCSSDLKPTIRGIEQKGSEEDTNIRQLLGAAASLGVIDSPAQNQYKLTAPAPATIEDFEIGRASCRERVCRYV